MKEVIYSQVTFVEECKKREKPVDNHFTLKGILFFISFHFEHFFTFSIGKSKFLELEMYYIACEIIHKHGQKITIFL